MNTLKSYPAYKPAAVPWLQQVPEHWEFLPFSAIARMKSVTGQEQRQLLSVYLNLGVIPFADVAEKRTNVTSEDLSRYQAVDPGDFVLNNQQAWRGSVGVSSHAGIVSPAYLVLALSDRVNPDYANSLFRQQLMVDQYMVCSKGVGSIQRNLYWPSLRRVSVLLPPVDEQALIARYLHTLDVKVKRFLKAKRGELSAVTELLLNVTQRSMRATDAREFRLDVATERVFRPVQRIATETYVPIGLYNRGRGIFHKPEVAGRHLGDSEFFWVEADDLVISGQFAWEGSVAIARSSENGCIASHRYPIIRGRRTHVDTRVLLAMLRTPLGALLMDTHSRGAAGRNRPLNDRTFLKEKLPFPSLARQSEIIRLLEKEHEVAQSLARATQKIQEYHTRLIADVVTGAVDVRAAASVVDAPEVTEEMPLSMAAEAEAEYGEREE